jgi:hypothetical protein
VRNPANLRDTTTVLDVGPQRALLENSSELGIPNGLRSRNLRARS